MNQNGIEIRVCVEGKPVSEYGCEGRTLVEGRKGTPFTIKVKNNNSYRTHAIVMLDGVNVMSGDGKAERGYILEGYSSYDIKGWRKSLDTVASFVFEGKDTSYTKAVKKSDAQCGVISIVAFAEKAKTAQLPVFYVDHHYHGVLRPCSQRILHHSGPTWTTWSGTPDYPVATYSVSNQSAVTDACSTSSGVVGALGPQGVEGNRSLNLGAGWGENQVDSVREVSWENGHQLCTMELYYTDARGLKELGIDTKNAAVPKTSGFPSGLSGTGFCTAPSELDHVAVKKPRRKR